MLWSLTGDPEAVHDFIGIDGAAMSGAPPRPIGGRTLITTGLHGTLATSSRRGAAPTSESRLEKPVLGDSAAIRRRAGERWPTAAVR